LLRVTVSAQKWAALAEYEACARKRFDFALDGASLHNECDLKLLDKKNATLLIVLPLAEIEGITDGHRSNLCARGHCG